MNRTDFAQLVKPMSHTRTYGDLWLCCLPSDKPQGCGPYFYLVDVAAAPHVAFRTRKALLRWLELLGLSAPEPIDGPGPEGTPAKSMRIAGSYRHSLHLYDREDFEKLEGVHTWAMDNGEYTRAIVTADPDGLRTIHLLNVNVRDRETMHWREGRQLEDDGQL